MCCEAPLRLCVIIIINIIIIIIIIIIIMDLQMVDDDYFYNTIQLTVQKKTTFDRSTKLKGLLPNRKSPRRRHRSLYYQKAFRSFPFFGRSFTTQGSIRWSTSSNCI